MLKNYKYFPSIFNKILNIKQIQPINNVQSNTTITVIPKRYSNYLSSPVVEDLTKYPEVEIFQNPPEWIYVERLYPLAIVPLPKLKEIYPSGWQPAKNTTNNLQKKYNYYIGRTKNHMVPVYLTKTYRGERRITIIRKIEGDIWLLEKELRQIVEKSRNGKLCASQINEMSGQIKFHGDYVNIIRDYLMSKGF